MYPNAFKQVLTSMARQLKEKNDDERRRLSQVKLKKSKSKQNLKGKGKEGVAAKKNSLEVAADKGKGSDGLKSELRKS